MASQDRFSDSLSSKTMESLKILDRVDVKEANIQEARRATCEVS